MLAHPDFPGEKLVACRNPELAYRRKNKRIALLKATTEALEKIQGMIERGYFKDTDKIGVRVGRVINKYKMAKHFKLEIKENKFCSLYQDHGLGSSPNQSLSGEKG